jgi:hypothetical protein
VSDIPEVEAREEALRRILAGQSSEATADEASAGVEAAHADREPRSSQRVS